MLRCAATTSRVPQPSCEVCPAICSPQLTVGDEVGVEAVDQGTESETVAPARPKVRHLVSVLITT